MEDQYPCQLYFYNFDFCTITKNQPEFFVQCFPDSVKRTSAVSWLNFNDLSESQSIEKICSSLSVERLSFEDIYSEKKRPKLEEYPDYMFFSIRSVLPSKTKKAILKQDQISFILGKNYIVSFQNNESDHFIGVRDRLEKKRGKIRAKNADYLLFRLLDAIVDNYFEVLDDITSQIEVLEMRLLNQVNSETLKFIELQKRKLIELRKAVLPLKDVVYQLDKINSPFIDNENNPYFADLKENCLDVLEEIDANKQILEGMANLSFAIQSQKMNEIMKVLTVVSAIFIPLTFIVGIYGMNFENIPELRTKNGYYIVLIVMFIITVVQLVFFVRRGWLKKHL